MIADWLRSHKVGSQEEVVARLSLAGISATQATVSRDLLELGAVKLKRDGTIRYVMADQVEPGHAAAKLDRGHKVGGVETSPAGHRTGVRRRRGSANLVGTALDSAALPEIAGTLAGDDTIFVALADGVIPADAAAMLQGRRSGS